MAIRKNLFTRILQILKNRILELSRIVKARVRRKPLLSFLVSLGMLFLLIALGNILSQPDKEEEKAEKVAKKVSVYSVGKAPILGFSAKVEKSGVIQIFAQASGIVATIHFVEGDSVEEDWTLLSLSANYQGDNSAFIARQIAQNQYSLVSQTHAPQKEIIAKSREIAEKTDVSSDELRAISEQSVSESRSLINLNNEIISTLDKNLENYTATNSAGINDTLILSTKQIKSQFLAANNGLNTSLRLTEYQVDEDNPQARLSNLQKEITLKQLEIQEKTLALNLEISRLQLRLAQMTESLMYPAAPVAARVERVHAAIGQLVNPGTLLFTLSAIDPEVTAEILVPREIAQSISRVESSTLYIDGKTFKTIPRYISSEATNGQQYSVLYSIPQEYWSQLTNKGYISVDVPIGLPNTSSTVPFIPIDSVYQTQDEAYIFVAKEGKARSKIVSLGVVYGRFVEVLSGLAEGDAIIVDRNVLAGDEIEGVY